MNQEVVQFINENPNLFFATVENNLPKVRPFQFMFAEGEKIYFCTGNHKEVFKQLEINPNIELSTMSPKFEWLRLNGKVKFINDLDIKNKIIENSPLVKSIYKTADNPTFEAFYIENWKAVIANFSGNPPKTYKSETI